MRARVCVLHAFNNDFGRFENIFQNVHLFCRKRDRFVGFVFALFTLALLDYMWGSHYLDGSIQILSAFHHRHGYKATGEFENTQKTMND